MKRCRVLFFTSRLGGGGAEMHLVRLLNAFDTSLFEIELVVARSGGNYESLLAPHVTIRHLAKDRPAGSSWSLLRAIPGLRACVKAFEPDVVCSVMDHASLVSIAACAGVRAAPALVANVQVSPSKEYLETAGVFPTLMRIGINALYGRSTRVVALSRGVADEFVKNWPFLSNKTVVIPNACVDDTLIAAAKHPVSREAVSSDEKLIVACGRLVPQKDFPTLLEALAILRKSVPAKLWILGEGPDQGALERQARGLGIDSAVRFLGFQQEPYRYMAAADAFVLSSRYEGLALVLVEAMAAGTAIVSTDCPHGPREVLRGGRDGILVPPGSASEMAAALERLLTNRELSQKFVASARERALEFHARRIAAEFGGLFQTLAQARSANLGGHTQPAT